MVAPTDSRLKVVYELTCDRDESPERKARGIALEQSVELPARCLDRRIEDEVVGRIESLRPLAEGLDGIKRQRLTLTYDPDCVAADGAQLLNLLFGNISLKSGVRLVEIGWPAVLLDALGGPRHGIDGLRAACGAARRPLLCTALKPLGSSAVELARRAARFAAGGVDVIKDDHGLADQPWATYVERVRRCHDAVAEANSAGATRALYAPHISGDAFRFGSQLALAHEIGCRAVLICPWLCGPDVMRRVADQTGMAVLAHPSMTGAYFTPDHGIAPDVLLGQLFRVLGADAVIYPNAGGRFPLDEAACVAINRRLREPLGGLRAAFPMPGGGVDARGLPHWIERYGPDTVFLIGGSLYARDDFERAIRETADVLRTVG